MKIFRLGIFLCCLLFSSLGFAALPEGIVTTVLTPLNDQGEIDERAARSQVRYLTRAGVQGIVLFGTIGEGYEAPDEHVLKLTEIVLDEARGGLPVLVGVQRNSIPAARALAESLASLPVAGIVVMPLNDGQAPSWDYVLDLFQNLSEIEKPLVYYNYPAISGFKINAAQLETLFKLNNVDGIKNSMPTRKLMRRHVDLANKYDKKIYTGVEYRLGEFLRMGADGSIGPMALFFPKELLNILNNYHSPEAKQLDCDLLNSLNLFSNIPLSPGYMKFFLCNRFVGGWIRDLALKAGKTGHQARVKGMLQKMGFPISTRVYPTVPAFSKKDAKQIKRARRHMDGSVVNSMDLGQPQPAQ